MFDFKQKRQLKSIISSRITQVIILIITFFILLSTYNRYLIARDMDNRRAAVESEIVNLTERRESLEKEVKYLTNERGIEAELRRQFDIVREGEQLIIILDDVEAANSKKKEETTPVATSSRPWYRFW